MRLFTGIRSRLIISVSMMFLTILGLLFIPDDQILVRWSAVVGVMAISIFLLNLLIGKIILSPIRKFSEFSYQIAENDLSKQLEVFTNDEFASLGHAVNTMLENLRMILQENLQSAERLALASSEMATMAGDANRATEEITYTMGHMAKATGEQFENVNLSVLASQQMAETAQQVAAEAQKAATFSWQASQRARNGEEIVQDVHSKMIQVKATVDDSADVVRRLGTRSLEIGKIVDVMRGISRRTNLLALNAAIEAARAGEHGRGFSVVADEVRGLAEQSTNSAIQIVSMINEIQNETKAAIEAMELGTKVVEEGTTLALSAKEAFSEITSSVNQTVNTIHEIAAASEQQAASSQEMSSTMQIVAGISKQNVNGANQVAAATGEQKLNMENLAVSSAQLVEMANQLTALVGKFKVKQNFQRCWRVLDCNFINCPAYQDREEKCWLIPDTLCQDGIPNGTVPDKRQMCHRCEVFKANTKIE